MRIAAIDKAAWNREAFEKLRTWPIKNGPIENGRLTLVTPCFQCAGDIKIGEKYTIASPMPALSVTPRILCPDPDCTGGMHLFDGDITFFEFTKPKATPVTQAQNLVEKVLAKARG
jgi:hypothetical protein